MNQESSNPSAGWQGLQGRVCVVTGAASGIGEQAARTLAAGGALVALIDRDKAGVERAAAQIAATGARALGIAADVTDPAAINAAAAALRGELGPCAVLVNNAGVQIAEPLMHLDLDNWKRALDVNLTGALVCARAFAQQMIDSGRGGSIVNIGSITGSFPRPNGGAYSPSKAAIAMLSRQLALELAPYGIRSNTIEPGFIQTALSARIYSDPQVARAREQMVPLSRIGQGSDIADVIVFLASDQSGYVTGQTLGVDGGLSQALMALVPRPKA